MSQEISHNLKLTIDISSIKNCRLKGQFIFKYTNLSQLNITEFQTQPPIKIEDQKEKKILNGVQSYTFQMNKNDLSQFRNLQLDVKCCAINNQQSKMIGVSTIKFQELLKCPVQKTNDSYIRILDQFLYIDQKGINIGTLRAICYLEDLGPYIEEKQEQQVQVTKKESQRAQLIEEINNLEYKVIWEFEAWKKNKQQIFDLQLAQKSDQYMLKLKDQYKKQEQNRNSTLQNQFQELNDTAVRIKDRVNDLKQREQNYITQEEQIKIEIDDIAKQIISQEDDLNKLKKTQIEQQTKYENQSYSLQQTLDQIQKQIKDKDQEFFNMKTTIESVPISQIKQDLAQAVQSCYDVKRDIDDAGKIKEQFKQNCEKLKDEILKIRESHDQFRLQQETVNDQEVQNLRAQLDKHSKSTEIIQLQMLQNDLKKLQNVQDDSKQQISKDQTQILKKRKNQPKKSVNDTQLSDKERLIQERDFLINSANYDQSDPLILELNKQIDALQN